MPVSTKRGRVGASKWASRKSRWAPKKSKWQDRTARNRVVALARREARRVVLQTAEPKHFDYSYGKIEMYHNTGTAGTLGFFDLQGTAQMPLQNIGDQSRIGDKIYVKGISVKMMLGNKYDRSNTNWRIMVLSVPATNLATTYSAILDNSTGNVLLDAVNTDRFKVIYQKFTKLCNTGGASSIFYGVPPLEYTTTKELTKPYKFYIPINKTYTFRTDNSNIHDQPVLLFCIASYDAYGTLTTDNIGYCQIWSRLHYKDP